jgi:hypothetical protein
MPTILLAAVGTGQHPAGPLHGETPVMKQLAHVPQDGRRRRTLLQPPRQSSAKSRSRCPAHKLRGRYRGCHRGSDAVPCSSARAVGIDNLQEGSRRRAPDTEPATRTPWTAVPSEFLPDRRWSGLRNSGPPPAGVSPRGTHDPTPPPCAIGSAGHRSRDATAAVEDAWLLLLREVCHTGPDYVPLIMRGCIKKFYDARQVG